MGSLKRVVLFLAVMMGASSGAVAQGGPSYEQLPNFQRVGDNLYRGGQPRKGGMERLTALGVRTVVNLRDDDDECALAERRAAEAAGLRYFNVPLNPYRRPADVEIERVLSIIDDPANHPVFVHCRRGADRTGTVVAFYRIRRDHWSAADALREARSHGMSWLAFEMKDYIADAYRRQLGADHVTLKHLHDSRTQLAGTAAAATRLTFVRSYRYSRRGLKRLSEIVP